MEQKKEAPYLDVSLNSPKDFLVLKAKCALAARDVEVLIRLLADKRADMTPPVSTLKEELQGGPMDLLLMDTPAVVFGMRPGGSLEVIVRHLGLGWQIIRFNPEQTDALVRTIESGQSHRHGTN